MTNISVKNRNLLKERYQVGCSAPVECQRSVDGTAKYLYRTSEGGYVETVYIPDADRATLCVSSQVGCRMNCRFCMTGKQGFAGHLSVTDILNQIYSLPEREHLTNIVFMGQGEPFDNLDNVLKATTILTADEGYAWSPKRITVSTVGLRKGLKRFLDESECHLAISLHNPFHEQRAMLMPAEKSYGLQEMIDLLKTYDFTHQRRLSFEYIMFDGVNDTMEHARELLRLLNGMECRMNLIRFHAIPNVDLKGSPDEQILKFRNYLTTHGLFSTIRASRGQDIYAACGLLSTAKQQNMNI
jgi:23S rRNA (adenine2503-C2)-methyltransferase